MRSVLVFSSATAIKINPLVALGAQEAKLKYWFGINFLLASPSVL